MGNDRLAGLAAGLRNRMQVFLRECSATTSMEYAVIASGIAVALVAIVLSIGSSVTGDYQSFSDRFTALGGGGGDEGGD